VLKDLFSLTTASLDRMTPVEQLDLVKAYFKQVLRRSNVRKNGGLKTPSDVYLAVFYPNAIGKSENNKIAAKYGSFKSATRYKQNSGLDTDKDGFIKNKDIVNYITKKYLS
jgi:hypothetical protein